MTASLATLLDLDTALTRAGFHPLSPWWRDEAARFYGHASARQWGARVGRGGAKSTAIVKVGLNETLFGDFVVPPGERHYFAIVSENKDEAANRLHLIKAALRALKVPFSASGDVIDLDGAARGFRVLASRIGAVSGFRCFGWAADEAAKWRADDASADPAREVIASMAAMTVTHPTARRLIFSSPVSTSDFHYETIERGDTDAHVVSIAPTWIANPSISEEQTRALEKDERIWIREYAAIPQAAALAAFDVEALRAAVRDVPTGYTPSAPVLIIDASSGRADAWTWCAARWLTAPQPQRWLVERRYIGGGHYLNDYVRDARGERVANPEYDAAPVVPPLLQIDGVEGVEGRFFGQISGTQIVRRIADVARRCGAIGVHGDQRESLMLAAAFAQERVAFFSHAWSAPNKERAVARVRSWLRDRTLILPNHAKLLSELSCFEERISASGAFTYGARGSRHDDFAALVLTAAIADEEGCFPESPLSAPTVRRAFPAGMVAP